MSVRSYEVTGSYSEPSDFTDYVLTQIQQRQPLHLQAAERFNDLADRRGDPGRSFTFIVKAMYFDGGIALDVQDADTGDHIQIKVISQKVIFTLITK